MRLSTLWISRRRLKNHHRRSTRNDSSRRLRNCWRRTRTALDLRSDISKRCSAIRMWCWLTPECAKFCRTLDEAKRSHECERGTPGGVRHTSASSPRPEVRRGRPPSQQSVRRLSLPAQVLGQDDRFGQFLHRAAKAAALVPQTEVSLFLRECVPLLQDAFGALHQLACLKLTLHFESLFHEAGVGFRQA